MSGAAGDYARDVAPLAPRAALSTLYALATRANVNCGVTFSGDWLCDATQLDAGSVRRHLDALADRGLIHLRRRAGRSHVVMLPHARRAVIHNTAHSCAGCRAWNACTPRAEPTTTPRNPDQDPAQDCAPNRTGTGSEPPALDELAAGPRPSLDEVRRIWTSARQAARA